MRAETRRGAIVVVALMAAVVTLWVLLRPDAPESVSVGGTRDATDLVQQYEPDGRQSLTPFTSTLLDGTTLDSDDLLGRPTVVNVWGSWCGPCRVEAPDLVRVARAFDGRVGFLGLNVRDSPDAARAFERAYEVPYPSVHPDDSARAIRAFKGALTAAAVPTTVVLDSDGRIAARVVGRVDASTLRGLLEDVLDETSTPADRQR